MHDDDEPAQNAKKSDQEPLSKSAAKNKKRREAARKKKDNDDNVPNPGNGSQGGQSNVNKIITVGGTHIITEGGKCDNNAKLSSDPEVEKKLRKLNEKLTAIQKLKAQQKEGKQLEKNQLEKISKENEIINEIQKLKI